MTLHEELLKIRDNGVPLCGICLMVNGDEPDEQLYELLKEWSRLYDKQSAVFPINVENLEGDMRAGQYHSVSDNKDVSYKHDYLCERWALLNYLINETE